MLLSSIFTDGFTNEFFGLNDSVVVNTYFFRVRAFDDSNQFSDWSNEIPASFVDPAKYEFEVCYICG